jgi:hypothetical protein
MHSAIVLLAAARVEHLRLTDRSRMQRRAGGQKSQVSKRSDKGCVGIAERIRFISVLSSDP